MTVAGILCDHAELVTKCVYSTKTFITCRVQWNLNAHIKIWYIFQDKMQNPYILFHSSGLKSKASFLESYYSHSFENTCHSKPTRPIRPSNHSFKKWDVIIPRYAQIPRYPLTWMNSPDMEYTVLGRKWIFKDHFWLLHITYVSAQILTHGEAWHIWLIKSDQVTFSQASTALSS